MDQIKLIEIRVKLEALAERIRAKGNEYSDELQTILEANLVIRELEKENQKMFNAFSKKQMQWAELSLINKQLKGMIEMYDEE